MEINNFFVLSQLFTHLNVQKTPTAGLWVVKRVPRGVTQKAPDLQTHKTNYKKKCSPPRRLDRIEAAAQATEEEKLKQSRESPVFPGTETGKLGSPLDQTRHGHGSCLANFVLCVNAESTADSPTLCI